MNQFPRLLFHNLTSEAALIVCHWLSDGIVPDLSQPASRHSLGNVGGARLDRGEQEPGQDTPGGCSLGSPETDLLFPGWDLGGPERDVVHHRHAGRLRQPVVLLADGRRGAGVAVAGLILLGVGELFGPEWERRQVDNYMRRREEGSGPPP